MLLIALVIPWLVIAAGVVVELYVRRYCLLDMLSHLKKSSLFSRVYLQHWIFTGRFFKIKLLSDIGWALIFARSNVRSGVLDPEEIAAFPRHFRWLAIFYTVSLYGGLMYLMGVWAFIQWQQLSAQEGGLGGSGIVFLVSISLVLAAILISTGLTIYACHYHLNSLMGAVREDHPSKVGLDLTIDGSGAGWRSMLFILMGRSLWFKGRKVGGIDPDVFDFHTLSSRLRWAARANILFIWVGVASAVIALGLHWLSG
ncbi:hypothetical protein RRX38_17545 [Pseudomonas sp. DTU_2021_1001937_2_SI_NGA_ILE_001]|uniref:hypothetical protein n=1 Tax=Pseudomonas sp. DTU_2021_1001937_2_SI_NGA_ILE_001 TaxID=3077589 RepID=UPI0028FC2659|nr:hypothetical protein [Pseudomonas sp. DTU_2021_1001937_2_SI_NGA_ILE_001]WNW12879.1 hypothetical protein RRX38_17545 [Pseudomonas sp. DTU_2021_1001937_2_SI_NGA_ILE_001]